MCQSNGLGSSVLVVFLLVCTESSRRYKEAKVVKEVRVVDRALGIMMYIEGGAS